jgi:uncharacterized protein YcgI (DUF1989 family)
MEELPTLSNFSSDFAMPCMSSSNTAIMLAAKELTHALLNAPPAAPYAKIGRTNLQLPAHYTVTHSSHIHFASACSSHNNCSTISEGASTHVIPASSHSKRLCLNF